MLLGSFLLVGVPLFGQEIMQNSDLSDGTLHWRGNCKVAGSDSRTDFVTSSSSAKGLLVELRSSSWTKVTQEIHELNGAASNTPMQLSIEYQVSSDFSLSQKASDYAGNETKTGIGELLDFSQAKIVGKPGQILAFIDSAPANRVVGGNAVLLIYFDNVSMRSFTPASVPQTFTTNIAMPPLNGQDNPIFCIAILT